jgi:DNA-binding response OmpR family regulator
MESKRILIIDDDKVILEILKDAFNQEGYSVFTSEQSLGTSRMVSQIKPHLLVMDVIMPGLNGDKICRILKNSNINKEMKIILYSNKAQDELKSLAAMAEVDAFLTKSRNYQELINKVNYLLKDN